MLQPLLPSGTVEYLPQQYRDFLRLQNRILKTYSSFGYNRLETSSLQNLDVLASQGDITKEIYAIARAKSEGTSETDRGLRFDLTKPFARYIAQHQHELVFPFKRSEVGLVFRGERAQKGRYRQLYQCDFDVVGREKLPLEYDVEAIEIVAEVFESLGVGEVEIRFNTRSLLQAIAHHFDIIGDQYTQVVQLVDKLEKIGVEKVVQGIIEVGVDPDQATQFVDTVFMRSVLGEVESLLQRLPDSDLLAAAKDEIRYITNLMPQEYQNVSVVLDLSIARGLDYYTGTVFETTLVGLEKYGSVCSGGRYDNLVGEFSKQKFVGVGGSVGLSRLFFIMQEEKLSLDSTEEKVKKIYIAVIQEQHNKWSRKYAEQLRKEGAQVLLGNATVALKKQLEFAHKMEVDEVHILEENELVSIKNMKTGEQTKM